MRCVMYIGFTKVAQLNKYKWSKVASLKLHLQISNIKALLV